MVLYLVVLSFLLLVIDLLYEVLNDVRPEIPFKVRNGSRIRIMLQEIIEDILNRSSNV